MRTIWLASYPKSGSTWFRILLANLSAEDGRPVDINAIAGARGIASARPLFEYATLLDSGLLTFEEIDRLRPRVYETLAKIEPDREAAGAVSAGVRFVKAHDAYTRTSAGEPLLAGARGADAAILIVRDPRDIAASLANHRDSTLDEAITLLNDPGGRFAGRPYRQHPQLRQILLSWSGHAESWLDQTDLPVHLVRYEDLHADPAGVLGGALAFAGHPAKSAQIRQAAALSAFAGLQAQEHARGFREAPTQLGGRFFRRGEVGAWRDELTAEQVARIEAAHADMMRRLGYRLAADELEVAP